MPSDPLRILVFNQFHRQPGRGGGARMNELARFWSEAGAEVTIAASTVDHASGKVPAEYAGRRAIEERLDGARVLRTWTLGADKSRALGRIARDLSFAASAGVASIARDVRPDVVVASSPPLFVGIPGEARARLGGVPFVFEVRDLWPDFAVEFGALRGTPARLAYALEARLYRAAAKVVVVTPAFVDRLVEKGVPRGKIALLPNGADLDLFAPGPADEALRSRLGWTGRFVLLYAGVHGPAQALDQILDAAEALVHRQDVLFALVGDGEEKPRLIQRAKERKLTNVQLHPSVPRERVPDLLRAADAGVATLKRMPGFRHVYPAKIFEILGCGRPLLLAAEGVSAALAEEAGAGLVVPPEDPKAFAHAAVALADGKVDGRAMGERGRRFAAERYDRRVIARDYLALLAQVSQG